MLRRKKAILILIISILFTILLQKTSAAETVTSTAQDKLPTFLSDVVGINMSNYNRINEGYAASYPSQFGGQVEQENYNFNLNASDGSSIQIMSIFLDGYPDRITATFLGQSQFIQQSSNNTVDEARSILSKYENFANIYALKTSELTTALGMLSTVNDLKTSNVTQGTMKMETLTTSETNAGSTLGNIVNTTQVEWVYTDNGVDATSKCLSITFDNSSAGFDVSFKDTWGLYSVAAIQISEPEAQATAWTEAQNQTITTVGKDNSSTVSKPDWNGMHMSERLDMTPGQTFNDSVNAQINYASTGNLARDPLTLYPVYSFVFYFNESVGDLSGIEVAVWGDTGQIVYSLPYGTYGDSSPGPTATPQSTISINNSVISIIISVVVVSAILATGVYVVKGRK